MTGFLPDSALVDAVSPSPNHGERVGAPPDALVLHYTGMSRCADALRRLCEEDAQVSAHYLVEEGGKIWQLVPESRRAWHAGRSFWAGCTDLNSRTIGIEICNPGHSGGLPAYPRAQIARVTALVADIMARNAIAPVRVLAHSDIAPDRKDDPGERFPWSVLERAGLAIGVRPEPARPGDAPPGAREIEEIRGLLARLGYLVPPAGWDETARLALQAFQRRWRRRRIDGAPDRSSLVTLRRLARAYECAGAENSGAR